MAKANQKPLLFVLCFFVCSMAGRLTATEYDIAPQDGSDANPGAFAEPWQTLTNSIPKLSAGETFQGLTSGFYFLLPLDGSIHPNSQSVFNEIKKRILMNFFGLSKQVLRMTITLFLVCLSVSLLRAQNCSKTSMGFIPLNDLGTKNYQGFQGGFYPDGSNDIPAAHLTAGLELAQQIEPLNSAGQPDSENGKYVFFAIGLSNTTQEFSEFLSLTDKDTEKNPQLILVDGAVGGWAASAVKDPVANYWNIANGRLSDAGVTPKQVQAVWLKTADSRPTLPFPQDAELFQGEMLLIVRIIKSKYPNTKIVYISSRTYAGYATTTLNPEPFAYQTGFAVKWLIQQQIDGDPELNFDPDRGKVRAPWLAWGPYLWTDGLGPDGVESGTPGRSDGLEWTCKTEDLDGDGFPDGDVNTDGTHPSINGRIKVANLLMDFVKSDTTAKIWYLDSGTPTSVDGTDDDAVPEGFVLQQNYPNPFLLK